MRCRCVNAAQRITLVEPHPKCSVTRKDGILKANADEIQISILKLKVRFHGPFHYPGRIKKSDCDVAFSLCSVTMSITNLPAFTLNLVAGLSVGISLDAISTFKLIRVNHLFLSIWIADTVVCH